jgi:hypothetical protein
MRHFGNIGSELVSVFALITIMFVAASAASAGGSVPYTFSPGETISSAQVNANFQALADQIAALQAQTAPASIVGTYNYVSFGTGITVNQSQNTTSYQFGRNRYTGTLTFAADGTVTVNGTGGFDTFVMLNQTNYYLTSVGVATAGQQVPSSNHTGSAISGSLSTAYPTDTGSSNYTVSGSTVTIGGGKLVGTLSSDGKIFVGMTQSSNSVDIVVAIRQ